MRRRSKRGRRGEYDEERKRGRREGPEGGGRRSRGGEESG